jgi:glycosyltransferase involved in cell wall biosynthesis
MDLRTENEIIQNWPAEADVMVSISCMTYNHEAFIEDTIRGFLIQETNFPFEIIIHDDASTDNTAEIIKKYEKKYPRLIIAIYQKENQYSKNKRAFRNFILPHIRSKYIATCEGDDYWIDPYKLQKQILFLESNPEYGVCVGGYKRLIHSTQETTDIIKRSENYDPKVNGFTFTLDDMKSGWITKTLTAVFRKDFYTETDFSKYYHTRDIHWFYHLVKSHKAFYFSEILGVYRIHEGGVNSMKHGKVNYNAGYNCYKELHQHNRDKFTRFMNHRSTLSLLNYNLYNKYPSNTLKKNIKLFYEAIRLTGSIKDIKLIFTAMLPPGFKNSVRNYLNNY